MEIPGAEDKVYDESELDLGEPVKKSSKKSSDSKNNKQPPKSTMTASLAEEDGKDKEANEVVPEDEFESGSSNSYGFLSMRNIVIAVIVLIIGIAVLWFMFKGDDIEEAPLTEGDVPEEVVDPVNESLGKLNDLGIGKTGLMESKIYEQGNLESTDFRNDFVGNPSPENYVEPIEIVAVNDSVSYVKHRTMTDEGMDMYWVEAVYKSKETAFTLPFYIWQRLAPSGVMDVVVEVVTDDNGNVFITSITAAPPSEE